MNNCVMLGKASNNRLMYLGANYKLEKKSFAYQS